MSGFWKLSFRWRLAVAICVALLVAAPSVPKSDSGTTPDRAAERRSEQPSDAVEAAAVAIRVSPAPPEPAPTPSAPVVEDPPEIQAVAELRAPEVQLLPSMMLVGDSITHGPAGAHTWRYFLYEHLAATFGPGDYFVGPNNAPNDGGPDDYAVPSDWDRDHAALSGRMLDCYLDGIIWDEQCNDTNRAADDFAAHNPDLAVVLLGANDVLLPWGQSAPSDFLGHAEDLVTLARANNPEVSFLLMGVIPVDPALVPDAAAERDDLNAGLAALAASLDTSESRVSYASAGIGFDPVLHTYDGVHPNSIGDEVIAANVAAGLADGYGIDVAAST